MIWKNKFRRDFQLKLLRYEWRGTRNKLSEPRSKSNDFFRISVNLSASLLNKQLFMNQEVPDF